MMKIAVVAILAVALAFCGVAFTFKNEPEGFRGLKWGDSPTEDMMFLGALEGLRRGYTLPNERSYFGDAHFYSIVYSFFDQPEILMAVHLYFNGEKNYDLLKTICRDRFGEETKEEFCRHFWSSQEALVDLSYNMVEEKGALSLFSSIIFNEFLEAQQKKQVERAEEDR